MEQVLHCLTGIASGQRQKEAEAELHTIEGEPGFGAVLARILSNGEIAFPLRQLAGILLRQYVDNHWSRADEKAEIRAALPQVLTDPSSKLRTAASMAISAIAKVDFPHDWPELMPQLLQAVQATDDPAQVRGALKCLSVMSDNITDVQLRQVIPILFPALLQLLALTSSHPEVFNPSVAMRCVGVYRSLCSSLLTIQGPHRFEVVLKELLMPTLSKWLEYFSQLLSTNSAELLGARQETVKTLKTLVTNYPDAAGPMIGGFLQPLGVSLEACFPEFQNEYLLGGGGGEEEQGDDGYDSDGEKMGLEPYLYEVMEFLKALLESHSKPLKAMMRQAIEPLVPLILGYMQMSQEEEALFESDPHGFVAFGEDEVSNYSVRIAGHSLLSEMLAQFPKQAVPAIVQGAQASIQEADRMAEEQVPHWWKRREVAVLALGYVADRAANLRLFDAISFVRDVLQPDLDPNGVPELRARAIWCCSHIAPSLSQSNELGVLGAFLGALVKCLGEEQPIPVRVAATKALALMAATLPKELVSPCLPEALPLMCQLLCLSNGETLHAVMDTLVHVVQVNPQATQLLEAQLTPLLLDCWSRNAADRTTTEAVTDILEQMMGDPNCLPSIQSKTLPVLLQIFGDSAQQLSGTVEAALDVYTHLVNASEKHGTELHEVMREGLAHVLVLLLNSDDHSVMEGATLCLAAFLRVAPNQIVKAQVRDPETGESQPVLPLVFRAVSRLLEPDQSDSGAMSAGSLVTQLLFKLSDELGPDFTLGLVKGVVIRFHSAVLPGMLESLVLVFARLIHAQGAAWMLDLLEKLGTLEVQVRRVVSQKSPPQSPSVNLAVHGEKYPLREFVLEPVKVHAVTSVLGRWLSTQTQIRSSYPARVTLIALLKLVVSGDPRVYQQQIDGVPLPSLILGTVLTNFRDLQEREVARQKARERRGEDEDEDEGDDDDFNEDDFKFDDKESPFADYDEFGEPLDAIAAEALAAQGKGGSSKYIYLSDLLDGEDDDDDLQDEEYPEAKSDPINQADLTQEVAQALMTIASGPNLRAIGEGMPPEMGQLLEGMLMQLQASQS